MKRFCIESFLIALVLIITYFLSPNLTAAALEDRRKTVTIENRGNPMAADYTNITAAINASTENTTIQLQEGMYIIDNPVILRQKGMRILGKGKEKTSVRPRNPGRPMFKFEANNVRVEGIGINAEIKDGVGRATFGIHIDDGYAHCEVLNTKIQNTGASAIIGQSTSDCTVDGNVILNAGDDGIRLRGDRLTISNNVLVRYFDEAIDLGSGDDIAVINNRTVHGRIGITVGGRRNILIYGNTVEDHILGGFHIVSKEGGVVSHNIVKDSRGPAYQLESLRVADANRVEGENVVGFVISDMHNGVIQRNLVLNADAGFRMVRSSGNVIYGNEYSGQAEQGIVVDSDNFKNYFRDNYASVDKGRSTDVEDVIGQKEVNDKLQTTVKSLLGADSDITEIPAANAVGEIDFRGESDRDKKSAAALAKFLVRHNPGFLFIHVNGNVMRSEITPDLYLTLKGSGQLGIGLVRAPVRMLARASGIIFPVWHLTLGAEEVAVITVRPSGPGAHILFTEKGEYSLKRFLTLSISDVASGLTDLFGLNLESVYHNRGKLAAMAFLLPGAVMGFALLWAIRRWKLSRKLP